MRRVPGGGSRGSTGAETLTGSGEGFAYAGNVYPSLSAVAKAITGSHTNGFLFFRNCLNHNKEIA